MVQTFDKVLGLDSGDGGGCQAEDLAIARRSGRALDFGMRGGCLDAALVRAVPRQREAVHDSRIASTYRRCKYVQAIGRTLVGHRILVDAWRVAHVNAACLVWPHPADRKVGPLTLGVLPPWPSDRLRIAGRGLRRISRAAVAGG